MIRLSVMKSSLPGTVHVLLCIGFLNDWLLRLRLFCKPPELCTRGNDLVVYPGHKTEREIMVYQDGSDMLCSCLVVARLLDGYR